MLLNEIGNTYAVEQLGQFSDTGTVRRWYWPASMWQQIGGWFAANGIPSLKTGSPIEREQEDSDRTAKAASSGAW
ncbi:hypothetical protein OG470_06425 [Micromonospora sp. NBC_00389]|uniref:hypothetical protein n=1 Tax=Micromonospora sp. NBC_00389 TaxID=2903586 RepID=UPI002E1C46C0